MMVMQSRAVIVILAGRGVGWSPQRRARARDSSATIANFYVMPIILEPIGNFMVTRAAEGYHQGLSNLRMGGLHHVLRPQLHLGGDCAQCRRTGGHRNLGTEGCRAALNPRLPIVRAECLMLVSLEIVLSASVLKPSPLCRQQRLESGRRCTSHEGREPTFTKRDDCTGSQWGKVLKLEPDLELRLVAREVVKIEPRTGRIYRFACHLHAPRRRQERLFADFGEEGWAHEDSIARKLVEERTFILAQVAHLATNEDVRHELHSQCLRHAESGLRFRDPVRAHTLGLVQYVDRAK
jgi:hypothetical protein